MSSFKFQIFTLLSKPFKVCNAIAAGNSVTVLGEAGSGKAEFAQGIYEEMSGNEFSQPTEFILLLR